MEYAGYEETHRSSFGFQGEADVLTLLKIQHMAMNARCFRSRNGFGELAAENVS